MALVRLWRTPSLLILTARSPTKAQTMSKQLKVACPSVNVKVVELDLSSLQSIRQAAMQLDGMTERIDILINNAGVMGLSDRTLSEDGVEMQFATNYLGHFLFTNLLMGKMVSSPHMDHVARLALSIALALDTFLLPYDSVTTTMKVSQFRQKNS